MDKTLPTEADFLAEQIGQLNKVIASLNVQLVKLTTENIALKGELEDVRSKD